MCREVYHVGCPRVATITARLKPQKREPMAAKRMTYVRM